MRVLKKYKLFSKLNFLIKTFPARLLKFNRPKWKKVQDSLKKFFLKKGKKNSIRFLNFFKFFLKFKAWERLRYFYKNGLFLKRSLFAFFDNSISNKYFKKELEPILIRFLNLRLARVFLKPLYRVDILLWKLKLVKSTFQAKHLIDKKKILVNNKLISNKLFLKQGDVILIKDFIFNKFSKNKKNIFLNSFLEVDYYTGCVVLLKSPIIATKTDLALFLSEPIAFQKFIDLIRTK